MATGTLAPLPSNSLGHTRVLYRLADGDIENEPVSTALAAVPLEQASPMRGFYSWRGKRNLEGVQFFHTTGAHVPFESRLEAQYVLTADFDRDIVAIAAQPVAFLCPHGTPGQRNHVPDFFIRHANGDGTLVDVRAAAYVDKAKTQFDATAEVCEQIGWHYEVWTGLDRFLMDGITFVSGYKSTRCAPTDDLAEALLDVYESPTPLEDGLPWAARRARVPEHVAMTGLYHLVWRQDLTMDMTRPLSLRTPVWRTEGTK